jgi:hypothetical protein
LVFLAMALIVVALIGLHDGRGLVGSDLAWRRDRPGAEVGVECVIGSVELGIRPERQPRLSAGVCRPG